jgi:hypothetical protein
MFDVCRSEAIATSEHMVWLWAELKQSVDPVLNGLRPIYADTLFPFVTTTTLLSATTVL